MNLLSWLNPHKEPVASSPPQVEEKKALQAELAQTVMTFERRRHSVQKIAEQALQSMREGH